MATRIFVYGTLRQGGERQNVMRSAELIGRGTIDGLMLNLGAFPGLIEGEGTVVGELWEVNDELLEVLDRIEGVHAGLYERREVSVQLDAMGKTKAQAYYFAEDPRYYGRGVVPGGDWIEFERGRRPGLQVWNPGQPEELR